MGATLGQTAENVSIAVHPLLLDAPLFQGLEQCATVFAVMLAVAKAAVPEQLVKLDKAGLHIVAADMAEAEFANAGGVDQLAAAGEVEQPGGGGGVGACAGLLGERADAGVDARQQAVDQRGFTHPRLADEDADVAI